MKSDEIFEYIASNFSVLQIPKLNSLFSDTEIYTYLTSLFDTSFNFGRDNVSLKWVQKLRDRISVLSNNKIEVLKIENLNTIYNEIQDFHYSKSFRQIFLKIQMKNNTSSYPILYVQFSPSSNGFEGYRKNP